MNTGIAASGHRRRSPAGAALRCASQRQPSPEFEHESEYHDDPALGDPDLQLGPAAIYLWSGYSIGWRNFGSKRDSFYILRLETLVASPFLLVLWWLMWRIIRRHLLTTTTLLLFLLSTYAFFQIGCITRWTREAELAADYVERCLHETDGELESLQELLRSEQAPNLLHGYDDDPPVSILITGGTATHAHEVFVMSDRYYWSPSPDYSRS